MNNDHGVVNYNYDGTCVVDELIDTFYPQKDVSYDEDMVPEHERPPVEKSDESAVKKVRYGFFSEYESDEQDDEQAECDGNDYVFDEIDRLLAPETEPLPDIESVLVPEPCVKPAEVAAPVEPVEPVEAVEPAEPAEMTVKDKVREWYRLVKGGTFPFSFGSEFDGNNCWIPVENGFRVGEEHVLGSDGVRLYYAGEREFLDEVEYEYVEAEKWCKLLRSVAAANSDNYGEYQQMYAAEMRMDVAAYAHVSNKFSKQMVELTNATMPVITEDVTPACPPRVRRAMIRGITEAADHLEIRGPRAYVDGALMQAMLTFCKDLAGVYTVNILSADVVHISGEGRHVAPFACAALTSFLISGNGPEINDIFNFNTLAKLASSIIYDTQHLELAIGLCAFAACRTLSNRVATTSEFFRAKDCVFVNLQKLGHGLMFCAALPASDRLEYDNPTNLFTNFGATAEPWVFGLAAAYLLVTVPPEAGRVIRDRKRKNGEGHMFTEAQERFSGSYDFAAARAHFRAPTLDGNTSKCYTITSSMFYPSFFSVYENAVTPYYMHIKAMSKKMLASNIIHSRNSRKK